MKARLTLAALVVTVLCPITAHALQADSPGTARSLSLRAGVSSGGVVSPGEPMSFEFQSNADACVIVFDIDTHGQVRLLYPTDDPEVTPANTPGSVPDDDSELLVEGERGVEFVFAVAVTDPSAIDRTALANLAASGNPGQEPYRIEGDPFLAANTVAGDLIEDISHGDATFAYTYFYVSERVDNPCYLCGPCDEAGESGCPGSQVVQNFDRRLPLAYPLRRGYEIMEAASGAAEGEQPSPVVIPSDDGDVIVNFYPYGSQVRYVDPNVAVLYSDAWWYDPYYWYYPGWYPYYPGFSVSIGFGWGWGWGWGSWGGYYCDGYYGPGYGGCYYPSYYSCYGGYPTYPVAYPAKYKSAYKSGSAGSSYSGLTKNRAYAAQRDADMRIASTDVRRSLKRSSSSSYAAHTRALSRPSTQTRSGYYGRTVGKSSASDTKRYTSRPTRASRSTYASRPTHTSRSKYTSRPAHTSRSTYKARPSYAPRDVTRAQMSRGRNGIRSGSKADSYGPRMRPSGRRTGSGSIHSRSGSTRSRAVSPGSGRSRSMSSRSMSAPRGHSAPSFRGGGWGGGHSAPRGGKGR